MSSGGMYRGVPLVERFILSNSVSTNLANPKSAILYVLLWIKILAGFRSNNTRYQKEPL